MTVIEHIKSHARILDVVSQFTEVKRSGSGYAACCVFHKDNTPSLSVNQGKGFFHCFSCGAKGDVIKFVMLVNGCDFRSACAYLVEACNIPEPVRVYRNSVRNQIRTLEQEGKLAEAKLLMNSLEKK